MRIRCSAVLAASLLSACSLKTAWSQNGPAAISELPAAGDPSKSVLLSGIVSDPSGARVTDAAVHIASADNSVTRDLTSDSSGKFSLSLPAGSYTVVITAPGFDPFFKELRVNASSPAINLDARLLIASNTVVQVDANSNQLSTSESDNASQLSYSGDQLKVFSDDDATFQQQILALAGSDGSHPPQIYVDGFSGGNFPPKSSIRSIKINENPFSAEYDQVGFGRIEISTKPGTGRIHGSVDVFGDPSAFNSQNPFLHGAAEPSYYRLHTKANVSGPLDKKTSFFVSADYYDQQNNAIINPTLPNGTPTGVVGSQAVPDPQGTGDYTARLDRQWSTNNTFTGRYEFNRVALTNGGLSALTASTQAYNSTVTTQTLQLGNSQVVTPHLELDSKFEWIRTRSQQFATNSAPTITVPGLLTGGGSSAGNLRDNQDHFEFNEKGTYEHGKNFIRAGVRWRMYREANYSSSGFNSTFTFNNFADYNSFLNGAYTAAQYNVTKGRTDVAVSTQDLAFYAEDEWKALKSLTLDLGARVEYQTAIPSRIDVSPHFGLAWALGQKGDKPAPVIIRFGAAIFDDRFGIANLLTTVQQGDPTAQQNYVVANPQFNAATVTPTLLGSAAQSTTYKLSPNFRSEYDAYFGGGAEFNLGKYGHISTNVIQDRGLHQWLSINANAPRTDGTRPFGDTGNKYEFDSSGKQWSTFFFINPEVNITSKFHTWAFFVMQRNYANFTGPTGFVSNSYNTNADYGVSQYQRHAQIFTGASYDLPWGMSINYFLAARAGQHFNITSPYDNNGDTIYNDRPSFTTLPIDNINVFNTPYGRLNAKPTAGEQIIPINYGHSPRFVSLQVQLSKTYKFGPRVADDPDAPPPPPSNDGKPAKLPDPRFGLTFSIEAQNITNTTNPAAPIGVLGSANFNQSIATANTFLTTTAANRTFALHTSFNF